MYSIIIRGFIGIIPCNVRLRKIYVLAFFLLVPVTFIDYYRADYGSGLEFYFVFLRESLSGGGPPVSYLNAVCTSFLPNV